MNGVEHYQMAEKLLERVETGAAQAAVLAERPSADWQMVDAVLANVANLAGVHATLALTMATMVAMEAADWDNPTPAPPAAKERS